MTVVPVGFCGWTIIEHYQVAVGLHVKKTKAKPESQLQEKKKEKENRLPSCLDVDAWVNLSRLLRVERDRVLNGRDNICRRFLT